MLSVLLPPTTTKEWCEVAPPFARNIVFFWYTYIFIYTLFMYPVKKTLVFLPHKIRGFFQHPSNEKIIEFPAQWDSQLRHPLIDLDGNDT